MTDAWSAMEEHQLWLVGKFISFVLFLLHYLPYQLFLTFSTIQLA
jgi:hypothetical protein